MIIITIWPDANDIQDNRRPLNVLYVMIMSATQYNISDNFIRDFYLLIILIITKIIDEIAFPIT